MDRSCAASDARRERRTGGAGPRSSRAGRDAGNADPDLRLDLLRDLQDLQDPDQPVVARDLGARRHHRHRIAAADRELQSSVHDDEFIFRPPLCCTRCGPRDRGAGPIHRSRKAMRCSSARGGVPAELPAAGEDGRRGRAPSTPCPVTSSRARSASSSVHCGRPNPGDGHSRSFGARTEGAAQMGNEKEGVSVRFARNLLTKRPPDPLDIATASCPLLKREGALIDAALAARSHDVAAGDQAAARHAGRGASAAISSFLRTSSCSSRSMFWNSRSLVRRRK